MKPLIKKLVEAVGPSGYEGAVRELVKKEVTKLADDVRVDALGNLIVRKGKQRPGGLRIMLSAHMDEIGIIATHIDENGFVRRRISTRTASCVSPPLAACIRAPCSAGGCSF